MPGILTELRSATRSLARVPTVTTSAVLCLALGIGATTAISSAISRALFQPPPFREPERLVAVHRITPQSGPQGTWPQSAPNYTDLARESQRVQGLAAFTFGTALVRPQDVSFQTSQLRVTGNLFPTLGVAASLGRLITPEDDRLDQPPVAVVSDEFWRTRLGGDSAVIGRDLSINGTPTTVIGVLPPDFRIPHGTNVVRADIWTPIRFSPQQLGQRRSNYLFMLGRLAPGETPQTAEAEMRSLFANLVTTFPQLAGENLRVAPLQGENAAAVRTPLLLLFGAVVMVLLIAAINVAALLLARGVQRQREMAVRAALGASGWDAMRPALLESAIITALGAAGGFALATFGVKTIGALAATRMRQLIGLSIDPRVILFGLAMAVVVAIVCGAVPAWRAASVPPQDALRGSRGGGVSRGHQRALRGLVVLEIALSLMLLIGAGLVLKAFAGLLGNDPGFDASRILTLRATIPASNYADRSSTRAFLEPALEAIRGVPGVEAAGAISAVPYITWGNNSNVRYEGQPGDNPTTLPIVEQRVVTPEFFAVTQQRLLAGRLLQPSDDESAESPAVVVVNQALVERDFRGRDPIGQRFHITDTTFATIVGVVSDIRNLGPVSDPGPEMYWSWRQSGGGASSFPLMVRVTGGNPLAVAAQVEAAIRSVEPTAAVSGVQSMTDAIGQSLGRPKFYFSLLGTFAAVAMVLTLAGLYGVLSYAVAQRTREMGIRIALGSPQGSLMRLVTGEGLQLVGLGLALGLAGGVGVTRLMTFMLYGVSPLDPSAWAAAAGLMIGAGLLAAVLPARRAAKVSPIVAIQSE